jgi:predicted enzyme related to lactoylglutathione lyase
MSEQATAPAPVKSPFKVTGDVTLAINVADLGRAIDWYKQALGFELIYRMDEYGWGEVQTATGGVSVGLNQAESPKGGMRPMLGVSDIDAARKHLEGAGATFDGPTEEIAGMVKLANFSDPDGNTWGLAQNLSGGDG